MTLWVVSKRGLSAKELSRQVGIHYETAWLWCHRFRACVGHAFGQEPLTGVVEMDEMHVGGTDDKAHKGRSLAGRKALVGGAVEVRDGAMGRVRLEHLSAADANQLEGFALRNIAASRWLLFVRILGAAVFSTPAMAQLTQRMGPT
ncbi:MAG: transposase [Myxococcaceae bacterium]|nr:transposase [Myxococcaceae bacterium]